MVERDDQNVIQRLRRSQHLRQALDHPIRPPAGEAMAFPLGRLDPFVTYGAPAILIETVNTVGLPMYARQLARLGGSAIDVKTEASILPVNKRPRLAVRLHSSN